MPQRANSIRMSDELTAAAKQRSQRLGYKTLADYVRSLIRYDVLVGGDEHSVTEPIARRPLDEQDRIDEEILRLVESRLETERGVLFEHLIEQAMAAKGDSVEQRELKKAVVDLLVKKSGEGQ